MASRVAPWRVYFELMARRPLRLYGGAALLIATTALASGLPMLVRELVGALRQVQEAGAVPWEARRWGLVIMGAALAMALTRVGSRLAFLGGGRIVGDELRQRAFARILRLAPSFFARHETGDIIARLTSDVNVCQSVCGPGLMYFFNAILLYAMCLLFMLQVDAKLTALIFIPYPFLLLAVSLAARRVKSHSKLAQEATGRLTTRAQETLAGIPVVKAFAMEARQQRRFEEANATVLRHNMQQAFQRGLIHLCVGLASGLTSLLVLWFGGQRVAAGPLKIEDFVAFLGYMGLLVQPTVYFGWVTTLLARGGPALDRVLDLIEADISIDDPEDGHPGPLRGELAISSLTFTYPSRPDAPSARRPALVEVSAEVRAGQVLGLLGAVGSGKSTLLRAIPRLIEVAPETVWVDGVPVEAWSLEALRRGIGVVPQDGTMFSMSLAENIALGRPEASPEEVAEAARLACLAQDLDQLPQGIDTLVGERGVTLSGGQRQRAAIARALLIKPKVLLFDDAMSMIDAETAARILENLRGALDGLTVIVAAHRTATLLGADELLVLEAGRVIERGAPAELLAAGGAFAEAHERQRLEDELEVEST